MLYYNEEILDELELQKEKEPLDMTPTEDDRGDSLNLDVICTLPLVPLGR